MGLRIKELKEQLESWFYEIDKDKIAIFLKQCEIAVVEDDYWGHGTYCIEVSLPPKIYIEKTQYSKEMESIEKAIRVFEKSDGNINIQNITWKSFINFDKTLPNEQSIDQRLNNYSANTIYADWKKSLERKKEDPEGAITLARSLLESVCKHILEDRNNNFNTKNAELSELYKATAKELNLAPEQHNEKIFKQILGGCSGIVNGLGTLRNKYGDSHGSTRKKVRPLERHAELAINLAGSMCLFLIETHVAEKKT